MASTSKVILSCHGCGKKYDVTRFKPGKRFRCKDCREILAVPTPAVAETGSYVPVKKLLFCSDCGHGIDVRDLSPGATVTCTQCQEPVVVPEEHEPAQEAPTQTYDGESKSLVCTNCDSEYPVGRYAPGRSILCLGCEAILVVPTEHVQDVRRRSRRRTTKVTKAAKHGRLQLHGVERPAPVVGELSPLESDAQGTPDGSSSSEMAVAGTVEKPKSKLKSGVQVVEPVEESKSNSGVQVIKRAEAPKPQPESGVQVVEPVEKPQPGSGVQVVEPVEKPQPGSGVQVVEPVEKPKPGSDVQVVEPVEKPKPGSGVQVVEPAEKPKPESGVKVVDLVGKQPGREGSAEVAPPDESKLIMLCEKCDHPIDVTGVEVGRRVMCPKCENLTEVPAGLEPSYEDLSASLQLQTISLDDVVEEEEEEEQGGPPNIEGLRAVFSEFHQQEEERQQNLETREPGRGRGLRRMDTKATRQMEEHELDAILEPSVRPQTLEVVLKQSSVTTPKRSVPQQKPFPVFLAAGLTIFVCFAGLMTYVLIVSRSKVKATETRKTEEQAEVQQEIKERAKEHEGVVGPGGLKVGLVVELSGVLKSMKGHLDSDRQGFLVVMRSGVMIWAEDSSRSHGRRFQKIRARQAKGESVCVTLQGTVRAIRSLPGLDLSELGAEDRGVLSELLATPPSGLSGKQKEKEAELLDRVMRGAGSRLPSSVADHKMWVEIEAGPIEFLPFEEYVRLKGSIRILEKK